MNNKPILTIAIPTYNRSEFLDECLRSIVHQIDEDIYERLEIFISDNGSTDNTYEIVQKYRDNYNIIYYKNDINMGMDVNYYNCIYMPSSKFVHLMSDDDIMLPGTIKAILSFINFHPDTSLIHLNSCGFDKKYSQNNISNPRLKMNRDICTKNKDEFIDWVGIYITFLSTIVINRTKLFKIPNPKIYFNTHFLCSHIPLLITKGDELMGIISHNCIAARGGNAGGYNLYDVWVQQYKRLLLETGIIAGYSKKIMKQLFINSLCNNIRGFIIEFRLNNTGFDLKNRKILIKYTYMYPIVWIKVYPHAFMPLGMLKKLKNLKAKLKDIIKKWRK